MKRNILWKTLIYFIIYSIIGFFMETIYAIFTKGMIESRKSFLYGPFCIIYGVGAICLTMTLTRYKNQNKKIFFYGMIVGCLVEYLGSYIGEIFLHVKWWDYSNDFLNINGRTCLYYAILWGFLSIALINYVNPVIDKYIDIMIQKTSSQFWKLCISSVTLLMIFDGILTCIVLDNFLIRVSSEYNIDIKGIDSNQINNIDLSKNYSNERMMMTYPNIIVVNDKNENIYLESLLTDVKNYYYKF